MELPHAANPGFNSTSDGHGFGQSDRPDHLTFSSGTGASGHGNQAAYPTSQSPYLSDEEAQPASQGTGLSNQAACPTRQGI